MSYHSAVEELYALGHELATTPAQKNPRKFDLANMRALMRMLGGSQHRFPSVLIAGTNGKGSTSATLASILHTAGCRTGLYTSPHLIRVNERIQINAEPIGDLEFAEMHARVKTAGDQLVRSGELAANPSFFEMLTAMAFEYFASVGIDIAVLEVGLGGRLDATNIVEPILSVITDISLDHQEWLGNTIAEIAREKAGILRPGGWMVTLPQHPEANRVLGDIATELNMHAVNAAKYVPAISPGASESPGISPSISTSSSSSSDGLRNRYPLEVMGKEIEIDSPLVGRHQLRNLALAIAAAEQLAQRQFKITAADVEKGIRGTRWHGRVEWISGEGSRPDVLLDVAHNPAGAWALRSVLSENFEARPITLIFGAMRDKPIGEMADILFPIAESVIATAATSPRAASPDEIAQAGAHLGSNVATSANVSEALAQASAAGPSGLVVVTGSVYVVGEALAALQAS